MIVVGYLGLWLAGPLAALGLAQSESTQPIVNEKASSQQYGDWGTPPSGPRIVKGINNCYRCHNEAVVNTDQGLPPGVTGIDNDGWVLLNEMQTWSREDRKHYQAYAVLLNERSQRMAKILGIVDPETQASLVHRDARCLACHSSVPVSHFQFGKSQENSPIVSTDTLVDPRYNLGVSCEGCHGPSGSTRENQGWEKVHFDERGWRGFSPQKKFDEFGFWNMRSPVTQSKICLSCHLGNVQEGKVITHAMYAAGHPPLPSFELATFVTQEPRHWRFLSEKTPELRAEFCKATQTTYVPGELNQTKNSLVAALVATSESARLTADLIDPKLHCPSEHLKKPEWPELANFACFACHHDLKREGWRQSRPRVGPPGRPVLTEWPTSLAEIAAQFMKVDDEFQALQTKLNQAALAQPFGKTSDLLTTARRFSTATDAWARQLASQNLTRKQGESILKLIATTGASKPMDYDSARNLVWAYAAIYEELNTPPNPNEAIPPPDAPAPEFRKLQAPAIFQGWMTKEKLTPQEQVLKELANSMTLDVRAGAEATQIFKGERRPRQQTVVQLERTLPKIARYEPADVQAAFQKLLEISK